ncbi:DUF885 domain-containing protein [Sphingomonas qomolangmaensis]|uniref:DUF885 family protein n=1 Tax=Sphingomonas qomolangmaensis TaxID=2918765 RepID=A0ABY5LFN8_9SPHN|nr:DUF885 family protein [Sphingomonas qomolangmaensis]UUL83506.1 DUF885 family protein [Sphingomonas qomolangmaensis]
MNLDRRQLLLATGASAALTALPLRAAQASADVRAQALMDAIAEEYLLRSPESATGLGIDTGARAGLKARSSDRSSAGRLHSAAWTKSALDRLRAVDTAALSPGIRTDIEVATTAYATAIDGFAFPYGAVAVGGWRNGPYVVAQNMGAYLDVPKFLDATHKVATKADADAYLSRLAAFADNLDGETERLRDARGRGVIASDVLMDKTLASIKMTREGPAKDWLIVESLARRTKTIPGDWGARAEKIATADVAPALDRQIAELELHRKAANADAGVWKFKDGPDYYAWTLRAATTTRMTPEEVHAMGQEELKSLQGEMDGILKTLGYTNGSVGERMTGLGKDPRFQFAAGDAGRAEIMAMIQATIADVRTRLPRAFGAPVKGIVEVKRIAIAEQEGAPLAYGGAGTIDGSVPGRFWINLKDPALHTKYSLPTLTFHESIPGHVWQGEYAQKLPLLRSLMGFSAMGEGWALYAEQLGNELGVYDDDPVGRLGYLQSIAFRACRLVVDTGLHTKRWTRDYAIDWFARTNGSSVGEVTSEVDRYCAWPGQACGYKIGHSEINRLRTKAQADLGTRYDFKAFNDAVVGGGGVPLTVLAGNIDRWMVTRRG